MSESGSEAETFTIGELAAHLNENADEGLASDFKSAWSLIRRSPGIGLSDNTTLLEFAAKVRELNAFRTETVLRENGGRVGEVLKTFISMAPKDAPKGLTDVLTQLDRCLVIVGKDKSRFVATKAFFDMVKGADVDSWADDFISSADKKKNSEAKREEGSGWAKRFVTVIGPHYKKTGMLDSLRPVLTFLTECLLTPDALVTADITSFPSRTLVAETIVVFFLQSGKVSSSYSHEVMKKELRSVMKVIDEKTVNPRF